MLRGYVYILCSRKNGTIYVCVTKDICARLEEHKSKTSPNGFTSKYNVDRLVYYEVYDRFTDALDREKQLKNWKRQWKIELIEAVNPEWVEIEVDIQDTF